MRNRLACGKPATFAVTSWNQKPVAVTVAVTLQVMVLPDAMDGIGIPVPVKLATVTLAGKGKLVVPVKLGQLTAVIVKPVAAGSFNKAPVTVDGPSLLTTKV